MKKILLALILSVTVAVFGISASAQVYAGNCGDSLSYTLNTSTGTLNITGSGDMYDYWEYYAPWHEHLGYIQTVTVGSGVTSIGAWAFEDCEYITSITLPQSLRTIDSYAFYCCYRLNSISLPIGLTTIDYCAFEWCGVTSISIPYTVSDLDMYAFENAAMLQSISVVSNNPYYSSDSYGVLYNKDKTRLIRFPQGKSMSSYTVGASVTEIDINAFADCTGLGAIYVNANNQYYSNDSYGVLYNKNKTTLHQFPAGSSYTSYTIPSGVIVIDQYAFSSCENITSLSAPNSIVMIGQEAFRYCWGLRNDYNGIAYIKVTDNPYFYLSHVDDTALSSYYIHPSTEFIGSWAFSECENLTSVTLPDSVVHIGDGAFAYCVNLDQVKFGNGLAAIGAWAFEECLSLDEITIPDGTILISYGAFNYCINLKSATIPESVSIIYDDTFEGCHDSFTIYGYNGSEAQAYANYHGFPFVSLGSGTPSVASGQCGDDAYWTFTSDGTLTITGSGPMYDFVLGDAPWYSFISAIKKVVVDNGIEDIGAFAFYMGENIESVSLPQSLYAICNYAFGYCTKLASINFPSGLTSIGEFAFNDCYSLTSVTIPSNVQSIDMGAFAHCRKITAFSVASGNQRYFADSYGALCERLSGDDIAIWQYPLGNTRTTYTIGANVEFINDYAFSDCQYLRAFSVSPQNEMYIADAGGALFEGSAENRMELLLFYPAASTAASYTVPNGVKIIYDEAFYGCDNLKNVTITSGVNIIEKFAFSMCKNLVSVTLPDTLELINDGAFSDCVNLASITIPASVGEIGSLAFFFCEKLTSVTIPYTVGMIGDMAFLGCENLTIRGYTDSYAEQYAYENDIPFVSIGKIPELLHSGSCGENVYWDLYDNGELIIYGSGDMSYYGSSEFPWYEHRDLIKTVTVDDGVTFVSDVSFYGYKNLTKVSIGSSVTSIGYNAFTNCPNLESFSVASGNTMYFTDSNGVLYSKVTDTECALVQYPIGKAATSYTIARNVVKIYEEAFSYCKNITRFYVEAGNETFYTDSYGVLYGRFEETDDTVIELVQYPIGNTISSYTIPSDVDFINWGAFANCQNIKSFSVASGNEHYYADSHGVIFELIDFGGVIDKYIFQYPCGNTATSYTVPDDIRLFEGVFEYCTNLTAVVFGEDYHEMLHGNIFMGSENISIHGYTNSHVEEYAKQYGIPFVSIGVIELPIANGACGEVYWEVYDSGKLVIYGNGMLGGFADNVTPPYYGYVDIKTVIIEEGVTSVGSNAFKGLEITEMHIPKSIDYIGEGAFNGCAKLEKFTVDSANANYSADSNGILYNKDKTVLVKYPAGRAADKFSVPNGVTEISYGAFDSCTGLAIVTIPNSVNVIRGKAFDGCTNITIRAKADSFAKAYAEENGFTYVEFTYTPGDADGDDSVTIRDAARILQYKADWDVEINLDASDVDGDGSVTIRDAARILQYKAGWDVTLG